jgi:hypothetical protein
MVGDGLFRHTKKLIHARTRTTTTTTTTTRRS